MSIRLIDLREAALREYPELGEVPPPRVPWHYRVLWLAMWAATAGALVVELMLVLSVFR